MKLSMQRTTFNRISKLVTDAKQLRDNQVNKIKADFIEMIQVASNKGHTEIVIDEAQYNSSILSSFKTILKDKGYKLMYTPRTGTLTISW